MAGTTTNLGIAKPTLHSDPFTPQEDIAAVADGVDAKLAGHGTLPGSGVTGQIFTDALGTIWRWDASAWVPVGGKLPFVELNATSVSIASSVSASNVTWQTEGSDAWSISDLTTVTVPYTGIYLVSAWAQYASNATGVRLLQILRSSGGNILVTGAQQAAVSGFPHLLNCSAAVPLSAGVTLNAQAMQNSGSALNISGSFRAQLISA